MTPNRFCPPLSIYDKNHLKPYHLQWPLQTYTTDGWDQTSPEKPATQLRRSPEHRASIPRLPEQIPAYSRPHLVVSSCYGCFVRCRLERTGETIGKWGSANRDLQRIPRENKPHCHTTTTARSLTTPPFMKYGLAISVTPSCENLNRAPAI